MAESLIDCFLLYDFDALTMVMSVERLRCSEMGVRGSARPESIRIKQDAVTWCSRDPMVTISTQVSKTSRAGGIAQVEISSKYGCNLFRGRDSGGINVVAERIPTETNHAV